jgi:hypothetical protein
VPKYGEKACDQRVFSNWCLELFLRVALVNLYLDVACILHVAHAEDMQIARRF